MITGGTGGAGTGGTNGGAGGSITLTPGQGGAAGSGAAGVPGVVNIDTPVFTSTSETVSASSFNVNNASDLIDSYSTIVLTDTGFPNATVTVPSPGNTSAGRTLYLASSNSSTQSFYLTPSVGPTIYVSPNTTATMIWNGSAWTGSSADTSLQGVYNDTAASPASIVTTSAAKTISVQAGTGFDAANLLAVANADGENDFSVGTTTPVNYVLDPDFAVASGGVPTDWTSVGSPTTFTQNTTAANTYEGQTSLKLVTTGTAGGGGSTTHFTPSLPTGSGTVYTVSFEAMMGSGTLAANNLRAALTGGGAPTCTGSATETLNANGFQQVSCTFAATSGTISALTITSQIASIQTIYIDAVQLSSTGLQAFEPGTLQLRGVVTSPVAFENTANSTTAFLVQNSTGTNELGVDTLNNAVNITAALNQSNGAYTLNGNAASTLETSSGALSIISAAANAATWQIANTATAATAGGALTIAAGAGDTTGAGGQLNLQAGAGGGTGVGGAVDINGGAGGTGVAGGAVNIQGGNGNGAGAGGNVKLQAGTTGSGTAGIIIAEAGTNSASTFQVQNSVGTAILNTDTTDNNGCVEVGNTTGTVASGGYITCNGQASGDGTLIIDSGTSGSSGLAFSQLNSSQISTSTAFGQLLGVDANGNVGISNAAVSLTSPALAYWDGLNNPTGPSGCVSTENCYSYPAATIVGSATFVSGTGEEVTPATSGVSGDINWSFAQVPFEEIQYRMKTGGGTSTHADSTFFYMYANGIPTTEFGTGLTVPSGPSGTPCSNTGGASDGCGYIIYFSEYHGCAGISYGIYTDGNQCVSGGGTAGDPLQAVQLQTGNSATATGPLDDNALA